MKITLKILSWLYQRYPHEIMDIIGLIRGTWYYGYKFHCPCCGWNFRKMLSYGVKPRQNAQCPRCFSLETHRLVWLYLKSKTDLFSAKLRILHIAPEYIFQKNLRHLSNLEYISADLQSPLAELKINITNIPCRDGSFDVILCSHVLEHIPNDGKAMQELCRVLKFGRWAILQSAINRGLEKTLEAPAGMSAEERAIKLGWGDHQRLYGKDYKTRLEEAGFNVTANEFIKTITPELLIKYGLMPNELIYLCKK